MLVQLHWQNHADHRQTDFVAQGGFDDADAAHAWANEMIDFHRCDCPEGWGPMLCTEDSEYFLWAAPPGFSTDADAPTTVER